MILLLLVFNCCADRIRVMWNRQRTVLCCAVPSSPSILHPHIEDFDRFYGARQLDAVYNATMLKTFMNTPDTRAGERSIPDQAVLRMSKRRPLIVPVKAMGFDVRWIVLV
jgi:hypothetical protein